MTKPWISAVPSWLIQEAKEMLAQGSLVEPLDPPMLLNLVQQASAKWTISRSASLVLLFSGLGEAARFGQDWGLDTFTVERLDSSDQDVTSLVGCLYAAYCVMKLLPSGLMWASPECRTWLVFVSRHSFKRGHENDFLGDGSKGPVREANCCALVLRGPQLSPRLSTAGAQAGADPRSDISFLRFKSRFPPDMRRRRRRSRRIGGGGGGE